MNKLTFIKVIGKDSHGATTGKFLCECGNKIIVRIYSVKSNHTQSCGCLNKTHKMSNTKFYGVYKTIKSRCNNRCVASYRNYGARGIKFLWDSFEHFYDDMYASYLKHLESHRTTTLERINNNESYSKENCRWATRKEQSINKRTNDNYTIDGITKCRAEWARYYGLTPQRVSARINRDKWTIEEALGIAKRPNRTSESG